MAAAENLAMGGISVKDKARVQENLESVYLRFSRRKERSASLPVRSPAAGSRCSSQAGSDGLPRILLMDEPSMGVFPPLVRRYSRSLGNCKELALPSFLEEQNARMALSAADRGHMPESGKERHGGQRQRAI